MNSPSRTALPKEANAVAYSCVAGSCVPFYVNPAVKRLTGYGSQEFSTCPQYRLFCCISMGYGTAPPFRPEVSNSPDRRRGDLRPW